MFISPGMHIMYGISKEFLISSMLFLFYNTNLLDKYSKIAKGLQVSIFIDDTMFFAISYLVEKNYKLLALTDYESLD